MTINRPPFDTVQLGRLGRIRLNRTWTSALKDVLDFYYASHPMPEWTFSLDDVAAAVGSPNPPLLINANEDAAVNPGDQALWASMGVPQKLTQPSRDPRLQPGASSSFWNTAIGSNAQYVKVTVHQDGFGWTDEEPIVMGLPTDPQKDVWVNGNWPISGNLSGTKLGYKLPVPSGMTTHSATDIGNQANFSGGALMLDGDTVVEAQGLVVRSGGVAMMIERSHHSLRGDGRPQIGGHGGSSLSGVFGSLRKWEAAADAPIQHALKCLVSDLDLSASNGGYRWPARNADSGYAGRYVGTNPELRMGALLAVRPDFDMNQLATPFGKRFAACVRDYGMYVVDEGYGTSWKPLMTSVEYGVNDVLNQRYGSSLEGGAIFNDLVKVWAALHVIANNSATTVGGGGTPRVPALPPV